MDHPEIELRGEPAADLFDGTTAEPLRRHIPTDDLNSAQRATLERLMLCPDALLFVNALRIDQVRKHGHSDESDLELESVRSLPRAARDRIDSALDHLQGNHHTTESLATARRQIAKACAIALAAFDRITFEMERLQ